jgi:hypothetical protein
MIGNITPQVAIAVIGSGCALEDTFDPPGRLSCDDIMGA